MWSPVSSKAQAWLFLKGIKPKGRLVFCNETFWCAKQSPLTEKVLDENENIFTKVTAISICAGYRHIESYVVDEEHLHIFRLIRFLNMCPKLKELNQRMTHPFSYAEVFLLMDQDVLKEMTSFSLCGASFHGIDMYAVNLLSLTCSKLVTIQFNIRDWNEDEIRNLLSRHSKSLTNVTLGECYLTESLLNSMIEFLSENIKIICLCALKGSPLTGRFGHELLSACTQLKDLTVFHQRRGDAPSQWWQNSVKVRSAREQCNCSSVFLNRIDVNDNVESGHAILALCRKIRKLSLANLQLIKSKFLRTLSLHSSHLNIISLSDCVMEGDSYYLLKGIFTKSPCLNTIHVSGCHVMLLTRTMFDLLCDLPSNVLNLFLSHSYYDLTHLLRIVRSNSQLELFGYWPCKAITEAGGGCGDCSIHNATLLANGGPKLKIIGAPPKGFSGGFFEARIL
jgi:hypothetical protein